MNKPLIEQLCGKIKAEHNLTNSPWIAGANLFLARTFLPEQLYIDKSDGQDFAYVKNLGSTFWDFFTDANHTRALIQALPRSVVTHLGYQSPYIESVLSKEEFHLKPYGDDPTHDACQVLRMCHDEGLLKDEQIKEWLNG